MGLRTLTLATSIAVLSLAALFISFPNSHFAYGQASTTLTTGVSITISGDTGGGVVVIERPATVTFQGYAYPNSVITILRNGSTIATTVSNVAGTFTKTVSVNPGYITFGIWAKDSRGLNSATTEVTMNVQSNQDIRIANIFLSPTITADKFNLQKGGTLRIFGSSFPGSTVRIFDNLNGGGDPIGSVITSAAGIWEYFFPTSGLGDGEYSIKANAQILTPNLVSPFSENLEFTIAEISCAGADFNFDTRVNIVDFSILIFYWERDPSIGDPSNICTDLNTDEIVNIFDFSILMHQWTE